jgi:cytochrome c5
MRLLIRELNFNCMSTSKLIGLVSLGFLSAALLLSSCTKTPSTKDMYVPTASDATSTSTLAELQQGRALYVNNCGECHQLYSPDSYSSSQWGSVLNNMAPRTNLTSSQVSLVKKYVSRGK